MATEPKQVTVQPVGPPVEPLPSGKEPQRTPMAGSLVRLEPLDVERHERALFESARSSTDIWTYLPDGPFATRQHFREWLEAYGRKAGIVPFVVVDQADRGARGMASYMNLVPAMGSIEVGYIWYATAIQRSRLPTETMYLMFRHVFDDLGYRRLEWKCNALNARSMQAARRLGFTYEGTFRQHMIVKGRNRDTAWFSLLDHEWPRARASLEHWLGPGNFDSDGRQRTSLSSLMKAPRSCT